MNNFPQLTNAQIGDSHDTSFEQFIIPTTVFNGQKIEQAFRFMISDNYIGKVMIKIRDEEPQKLIKPTPKQILVITKTYMLGEKSYVSFI